MFSHNGANTGVNFAIPINLVKDFLPQLLSKGRITRGWLGISTQVVSPRIAGYDGKAVVDAEALPGLVANTAIGRNVALYLSRHGIIYRALVSIRELQEAEQFIARAVRTRLGTGAVRLSVSEPPVSSTDGLPGDY